MAPASIAATHATLSDWGFRPSTEEVEPFPVYNLIEEHVQLQAMRATNRTARLTRKMIKGIVKNWIENYLDDEAIDLDVLEKRAQAARRKKNRGGLLLSKTGRKRALKNRQRNALGRFIKQESGGMKEREKCLEI